MASRNLSYLPKLNHAWIGSRLLTGLMIAAYCVSVCVGCSNSSTPADGASTKVADASAENSSIAKSSSTEVASPAKIQTAATNVSHVNEIPPTKQPAGFQLSGIWYGESRIDVDAANSKLSNLTEAESKQLQSIINSFGSIVMAAEFRADGVLELDMMIAGPDGTPLRDRSIGSWKTVGADQTAIKIETSEYSGEETEPKTKLYLYKILGKDQFEFVPESIHPELFTLSPRIVFQRVKQPLDDASIAEEPSGNSLR